MSFCILSSCLLLKKKEDLEFVQNSAALQKVIGGGYMICLLCMEKGLPLKDCLKKLCTGSNRISNLTRHLSEQHKARIKELKEEKEAENAKKQKGAQVCVRYTPFCSGITFASL